jgi:small subunit ribosomal protein S6e
MPFKINIGTKQGKTYKFETESEELVGKSLGDKLPGKELSKDFEGYEFEITGTSDMSGFTSMKDVDGIGLKKVLLTYGKSMHKRSKKEGKRKRSNPTPGGLRLRKTVRGKIISPAISQINLKLIKEGSKKLTEIFPEIKPEETQGEKANE